MLSLTERFDAFWDETQEHRVLVTQDMEALRADMQTVLANQAIILQQQQICRPSLLNSWLSTSHHHLHRSDIQGSSLTLYVFFFLTSGDTGSFVWGGGGGEYFVQRLCFYVLFIVVLVLVVYSIFSLFCTLVMFVFFFLVLHAVVGGV